MKSLSILLILTLCAATCFAQTKADSLKAAAIFNKSKDAYAHLKTYTDSGKVIRTMISEHTSKTAMIFKSAYTSAGDFNFDGYKEGQSNSLYTVNRTANTIKTWWGITDKEADATGISTAMAGTVGALSGNTTVVPQLLMPSDFKGLNVFKGLKQCSLAGDEKINGKDCYIIKGERISGVAKIWIAKSDFLIRKIEGESIVNPAKTEASLRQAIAIGKTRGLNYSNLEDALKTYHEIGVRDSLSGHPRRPFTVKESYVIVPVTDHKVNPVLLKYRPNREVAL